MKNILTFEHFKGGYIDKRVMSMRPPENLAYLKQKVEIRIDLEKVQHTSDRQFRHGIGSDKINNDDITETVELAIEELTIALMQDKFDIYQNEDNYPTKGVKAGEPNRFLIKNTSNNLNVVCQLEPGEDEFKLTVITVMRKPDFRAYPGQYVINVKS